VRVVTWWVLLGAEGFYALYPSRNSARYLVRAAPLGCRKSSAIALIEALRSPRMLDFGPVAVEISELTAIEGPDQTGGAGLCQRMIAVKTKQSQSVPTQLPAARAVN
jgi:hypothetical protein